MESRQHRGGAGTSFADEQRQLAQVIIDNLRPQYLSVLNEPGTFARNLGLPTLYDVENATTVLQDILSGLDRGTTKIGAGTGTWTNPAFLDSFLANTSIDFASMHVYPLGPAVLANLDHAASATAASGKEFVLDEILDVWRGGRLLFAALHAKRLIDNLRAGSARAAARPFRRRPRA